MIGRKLGHGANGSVFLAKSRLGKVAIKFSEDSSIIASEVNVLKALASVQQGFTPLSPLLLDVDDYEKRGEITPFYAMEYIEGENLLDFIGSHGYEWLPHLIYNLLSSLALLHQEGWVFGDLKPDNLIVDHKQRARLIDVGGTTKSGRAIKEFTDFFDRGYWGMGDRKADATYDLFAVAMIMINACYGKKPVKQHGGLQELTTIIKQHPETRRLKSILLHAIKGQYREASEMQKALRPYLQKSLTRNRRRKQSIRYQALKPNKLEAAIISAVALGLYIFSQIQ